MKLLSYKITKIGEEKKLPSWIYTDEKNTKVNASKLGYEIMNEIPMIRTNGLLYGARFDKNRIMAN